MSTIENFLGPKAQNLLGHTCKTIPRDCLHLPGPDFVDRVWKDSNRSPTSVEVLAKSFQCRSSWGMRGYLSLLPVDQGIEHSAGASFAPNPLYFDPQNIVKLAIEGGCNGVASILWGFRVPWPASTPIKFPLLLNLITMNYSLTPVNLIKLCLVV